MNKSGAADLVGMCDKCHQLDQKIARYRAIMDRVPDSQLEAGITKLIAEAHAEKAVLHPEQEDRG